jgi:deoxyribodipyrimidine photo-lyase
MHPSRMRVVKEGRESSGPVVYWMSRDQRAKDNWAFIFAQELALNRKRPLVVIFCLVSDFPGATMRHYGFMLRGLSEVQRDARGYGVPLVLLQGQPANEIPTYLASIKASSLVTDFDPLRMKRKWKRDVVSKITLPIYEVDAHNIIPCWITSPKQEYGAHTIRPKMRRLLPSFLETFPRMRRHRFEASIKAKEIKWKSLKSRLKVDASVSETDWILPGPRAAAAAMKRFVRLRLKGYPDDRNDPNREAQSGLSPYLHFGQLSAQRLALEVTKSGVDEVAKEAFLEELIVRRELSDNYCYYNDRYDTVGGFPRWARETLDRHRADKREYTYSMDEFESGRTHEDLWNAAQMQMVRTGKMHGYMRMYWAKKILEWSRNPEDAMRIAIYLNDKYELDGGDPNGYAGIAWSIGGVHDRAWTERPIFGKIRYMNRSGCARKFDIEKYVASFVNG